MSWTDPAGHVWTVGEIVTAANMNTYVESNLVFLGTPPSVCAFDATGGLVPNATGTAISLASERWKSDSSMHSTTVNTQRLVAPVAGKYLIIAHIGWAVNATGTRVVQIRLNGTTIIASDARPATAAPYGDDCSVPRIYTMAVGDYVEAYITQNSGGALALGVAGNYTPEFTLHFESF